MADMIYCNENAHRRFNALIDYLGKNNKFYSKYITNTCAQNDFSLVYSSLPYVDKNFIKSIGSDYFSCEDSETCWEYTSGSSGIPFKCYKLRSERNVLSLYIWDCRRKIDENVTPRNFLELLGKRADKSFDFSDLSHDNVVEILKYINDSCARWLCLSPTMAYYYAVVASELNMQFINIKYLELQGEYIDLERRKFIEKVFGAKTVLQYGMRETWTIAYECPHGHLRLISDLYQVELHDIDEAGFGEVVLSSNVNKYMPFIKYQTGDIAKISVDRSCNCGNKNPYVIEMREGRKANCITGNDNLIADIVFKRIIRKSLKPYNYDAAKIKAFSVLQTANNEFVFFIVPGQTYCKEIEKLIKTNTQKIIGKNVMVTFNYKDKVLINENGKQMLFRCDFEGEKNEKIQ